ncbi:myoferlin [Elysia marginata]|uniref:Myoferlin n=1 Tax=Elysia marginata TaxID=1093978 RepID=A0AAV4G1S3_9GAST|nr:myoferlin [Elysia marginata]
MGTVDTKVPRDAFILKKGIMSTSMVATQEHTNVPGSTKDKTLTFPLAGQGITSSDQLNITVFDWERVGRNRQLGTAKVPLGEFARGGNREKTVNLMDGNGREIQGATIQLVIKCDPPPEAKGAGGAGGATGTGADEGGAQVVEVAVDTEEGEEEAEAAAAGGAGGAAVAAKGKKKRKVRSKTRPSLSSKPQDQQVSDKKKDGYSFKPP